MIVFIYRLLSRLTRFILLDIPLILTGMVVLLPYLPYQTRQIRNNPEVSYKLPFILRWFDCADLYQEFNRNPVTYLAVVLPQGWLYRWYWLTVRNPLNYFSYKYLAVKAEFPMIIKTCIVEPEKYVPAGLLLNIGDSTGALAGYRHVEYKFLDGTVAYEYLWVRRYKHNPKKCLRIRLGYKLGLPDELKRDQYQQDVLNFSPYSDYNGL